MFSSEYSLIMTILCPIISIIEDMIDMDDKKRCTTTITISKEVRDNLLHQKTWFRDTYEKVIVEALDFWVNHRDKEG